MATVDTRKQVAPSTAKPRERGGRRPVSPGRIALYITLSVISLLMVVPFVWMVITSLKSPVEIASQDAGLLPSSWQFGNYVDAFEAAPFATYARNSFIIAISHTVLNVLVASMAGYALARIRFRGSEVIFYLFIAALMIPTYTKVLPEFLIVRFMPLAGGNDILGQGGSGWLDTWWALIIPGAVTPFAVFLFRQFYLDLPVELEEAARLDGLGEFRIYARIMTPQVKPALTTVALLTFESSWNNFLWPLLVTRTDSLRVIQVGLSVFKTENGTQWHFLMAGTTLATLPMVLLFLIGQRYFVQGFATAGLK
ncbi:MULTISPECIES: carbohydrate ABC transporter permease [Streptomyces]|uniref:carbohydrate ABC transporter permease n=1 Tax=Streptomyces TaxID=1883 RepID=UPI000851964F|nr:MULTISPECIES: carbohydrate ABC transporter permease [unclassified Streptomyces]MBQ1106889.1 carbohydrate ABC transporter permease [Streptomyces sp. 404i]MBQ1113085.1 carbohydrate ABC transporter permease [Streptomyces sp. C3-3]MDQ0700692.1 ABC-type glycerol-3-phosphate transport system permease component [Streptomyces sp. W4I9-2]MDX3486665.1 carbohydrate ABC transporter permease [Streptomyces sp. ID05-18]